VRVCSCLVRSTLPRPPERLVSRCVFGSRCTPSGTPVSALGSLTMVYSSFMGLVCGLRGRPVRARRWLGVRRGHFRLSLSCSRFGFGCVCSWASFSSAGVWGVYRLFRSVSSVAVHLWVAVGLWRAWLLQAAGSVACSLLATRLWSDRGVHRIAVDTLASCGRTDACVLFSHIEVESPPRGWGWGRGLLLPVCLCAFLLACLFALLCSCCAERVACRDRGRLT